MTATSWVLFALLSPLLWSFVYVLDAYCVETLFTRPWIGVVTSSFLMLALFPLLILGLLFTDGKGLTLEQTGLALLAGAIFVVGQSLYFQALAFSESGIVAAYFNLLPVFLLIAGFLWLGERFAGSAYLGAGLLIAGSCAFCLLEKNRRLGGLALLLMTFSAASQAAYFLILSTLLEGVPGYPVFVTITFSMILSGLIPLGFTECRSVMFKNFSSLLRTFPLLIAIEAINLLAVAANQRALELGPASLVATVEATAPAFSFVLSAFLYGMTRKYGEPQAIQRLIPKLGLILMMAFGVWMVS